MDFEVEVEPARKNGCGALGDEPEEFSALPPDPWDLECKES
jgi:hypothetical protein